MINLALSLAYATSRIMHVRTRCVSLCRVANTIQTAHASISITHFGVRFASLKDINFMSHSHTSHRGIHSEKVNQTPMSIKKLIPQQAALPSGYFTSTFHSESKARPAQFHYSYPIFYLQVTWNEPLLQSYNRHNSY